MPLSPLALPAVLALVFNALIWGVSWWPFRQLQLRGLHPLWATVGIFVFSAGVLLAWRPGAWRTLRRSPPLWLIAAAAGTTNACFNWGITVGEVLRVVLLFYLMPLWSLLFARLMLGERITAAAWLRVVMALAGAALVLTAGQAQDAFDLRRFQLADLLGLAGGVSFAFNNIQMKRTAGADGAARGLAMFLGGAVVAAAVAVLAGAPPPWAARADQPWTAWLLPALALGLLFLCSNLAYQYGASRLPAQVTGFVMLTEVVFAGGSAVWLAGEALTAPVAAGAGLIIAAAALATWQHRPGA